MRDDGEELVARAGGGLSLNARAAFACQQFVALFLHASALRHVVGDADHRGDIPVAVFLRDNAAGEVAHFAIDCMIEIQPLFRALREGGACGIVPGAHYAGGQAELGLSLAEPERGLDVGERRDGGVHVEVSHLLVHARDDVGRMFHERHELLLAPSLCPPQLVLGLLPCAHVLCAPFQTRFLRERLILRWRCLQRRGGK